MFIGFWATRPRQRSERGATAVEYALMMALIAVVIVGSVAIFGTAVRDLFIVPFP